MHRAASETADRARNETLSRLETVDLLFGARVETAMRILRSEVEAAGSPNLEGQAAINGKSVPDLRFGKRSQILDFEIADHVKQLAGGTATIFVWNGTAFIRVSTNILKTDGSRAVGTQLDSRGKAFAALTHDQPFEGVVDILAVPYFTRYEPLTGANGRLVGAIYAGYRLDSINSIGESIARTAILNHGFVALLKPGGAPIFKGEHITDKEVERLLTNPEQWHVERETFAPWNYTVLSAYQDADITRQLRRQSILLAAAILILTGLVVATQLVLLKRFVLAPVNELRVRLDSADLNTLIESTHKDEISALAEAFNRFVLRIRHTLIEVRHSSSTTAGKSAEIRNIGERPSQTCRTRHRGQETPPAP